MILQIGAFFGSLLEGVTGLAGGIIRESLPGLEDIGKQFLQRELSRKLVTKQKRQIQAQAVQALNTPGIAVTRIGGTKQPVGGRVQRSTFTPAALTPAQTPLGNIPLLPVTTFPLNPFDFKGPVQAGVRALQGLPIRNAAMAGPLALPGPAGPLARRAGAPGEPRFARDEMGNTIMFVPSPRPGEGFIRVFQARQLGLKPTKPFWRFNRFEGQFEKMKGRRMNPFNFSAAKRAGRRIEATLDAVKEFVRIERKMTTGKVRLKKTKKRK